MRRFLLPSWQEEVQGLMNTKILQKEKYVLKNSLGYEIEECVLTFPRLFSKRPLGRPRASVNPIGLGLFWQANRANSVPQLV